MRVVTRAAASPSGTRSSSARRLRRWSSLFPPARPHRPPVLAQFGKVDADAYVLDFDPSALAPAQALAVAVSMFSPRGGV